LRGQSHRPETSSFTSLSSTSTVGAPESLALPDIFLPCNSKSADAMLQQLETEADEYQKSISMYHLYKWVFSGRKELDSLIQDLETCNNYLDKIMKLHFKGQG
jgi:hypothetical protein